MTDQPDQTPPRAGTKSACHHCGEEIVWEPWFRDGRGPNPPVWSHTRSRVQSCSTQPDGWTRDSWPFAEPEQDHCLDNPQLTAAIGHPVRCPHCDTTVPPTHWTKHIQRHHPNEPSDPTQCSGEEGFCLEHGYHRHSLKQPARAIADAFEVPLHLIGSTQPVERCGAVFPAFEGTLPTECVLRPGHQGSHANEYDTRWIEKPADGYCPHCGLGDAGPTADAYEELRQRAEQAEAAVARVRALPSEPQVVVRVHIPGQSDQEAYRRGWSSAMSAVRAALEPPEQP